MAGCPDAKAAPFFPDIDPVFGVTNPAAHYHVPVVGDVVPNYLLLNQSGKTIDLQQFRGKVVAMTFVYTRCPLPDYCVRMSRNFAEMDKALSADPKLYAKTHLLTVSFDPTYDTPKVLRSYGGAYTGRFSQETFAHWDFAAPRVSELPVMEHWFDVGVTSGPNGSLSHTLATTIIGPDGKVSTHATPRIFRLPSATRDEERRRRGS